MHKCRTCEKILPKSNFRVREDRSNYRIKDCRSCEKGIQRETNRIRKLAPPMPSTCDCCGLKVSGTSLHLDHCHETKTFRGWICNRCNHGIGSLGDNIQGLENALKYLRRRDDSVRH